MALLPATGSINLSHLSTIQRFTVIVVVIYRPKLFSHRSVIISHQTSSSSVPDASHLAAMGTDAMQDPIVLVNCSP